MGKNLRVQLFIKLVKRVVRHDNKNQTSFPTLLHARRVSPLYLVPPLQKKKLFTSFECDCYYPFTILFHSLYPFVISWNRKVGDEGWLGFQDLWCGQKPWWNWYLTPVVNFGEIRRAQLAKSTLLHVGAPGIFSDAIERVEYGKQREATAPIHP